jgi:hypothetical protein
MRMVLFDVRRIDMVLFALASGSLAIAAERMLEYREHYEDIKYMAAPFWMARGIARSSSLGDQIFYNCALTNCSERDRRIYTAIHHSSEMVELKPKGAIYARRVSTPRTFFLAAFKATEEVFEGREVLIRSGEARYEAPQVLPLI